MQLKMSVSPKSPNTSASSGTSRMSSKIDDDDDYDDDEDIEDPESLNRTLSEIIEGKRSSSSLIAILNRENSDCDTSSVKSSGSENSSCGHKLVKTNSFKGAKIEERDSENSDGVSNSSSGGKNDVPVSNCDSAESQVENSAINQSTGSGKTGTQSMDIGKAGTQSDVTGSQTAVENKLPSSAMQVNQSKTETADLSNGGVTYDANENLHSKGAKHGVDIADSKNSEQTTS